MDKFDFTKFQDKVDEVLIRHKSILDIITKMEDSNARISRAIIKSSTSCGCVEICAKKQDIPEDISLQELPQYMNNHLAGKLCPICKEKIKQEFGDHLFYLAAMCSTLDIDFEEVLKSEYDKINTLGRFSLL